MNYFVIGSGSIGIRHTQNLKTLGAKVSLHSWRGINLSKVLSDVRSCNGAAAVVIATGTNIRVPLILELAQEGAALYIEKPLAFKKKALGIARNATNAIPISTNSIVPVTGEFKKRLPKTSQKVNTANKNNIIPEAIAE